MQPHFPRLLVRLINVLGQLAVCCAQRSVGLRARSQREHRHRHKEQAIPQRDHNPLRHSQRKPQCQKKYLRVQAPPSSTLAFAFSPPRTVECPRGPAPRFSSHPSQVRQPRLHFRSPLRQPRGNQHRQCLWMVLIFCLVRTENREERRESPLPPRRCGGRVTTEWRWRWRGRGLCVAFGSVRA